VLVVDDEPDLIATYVRLLERQGYRVVAAGTRGGALTIIEREPLRLVISDVRLPDGNGFEIIRAATARPRSPPAIVVTGFSSEATRLAAFESGASACFAKPFAAPKLLQTVKELCIE
jgi:CheY-like chemotaxis protein